MGFTRTVDRFKGENLRSFALGRGMQAVMLEYEAMQRAPEAEMKRFLASVGIDAEGIPGDVFPAREQMPEDLSELLLNFEEIKEAFSGYPCLQRQLMSAEPESLEPCSRDVTAALQDEIFDLFRRERASSKQHLLKAN